MTGRILHPPARRRTSKCPQGADRATALQGTLLKTAGLALALLGMAGMQPVRADGPIPMQEAMRDQVGIGLSLSGVGFLQTGKPGWAVARPVLPGNPPSNVILFMACAERNGCGVTAQSSPLNNQSAPNSAILPENLFVGSPRTRPEGGEAPVGDLTSPTGFLFLSLERPRVVAETNRPGVSFTPLKFQLLTRYTDQPGVYIGVIQFTAVAKL